MFTSTAPTITSGHQSAVMPFPTADQVASCNDVLERLVPVIDRLLAYLRSQNRHPDTSWLEPTEIFQATDLYFTGDELNRLLDVFQPPELGGYSAPPAVSSRTLLAVLRTKVRQQRRTQ